MSRRFRFSRGDVFASIQRQQVFTQAQVDAIRASLAKGQWGNWIDVDDPSSYIFPWQPADEPLGHVRYRKNSANIVQFAGGVKSIDPTLVSSTQAMFGIWFAGYRPVLGKGLIFPCLTSEAGTDSFGRIDFCPDTSNAVVYMSGGRDWISLAGVMYVGEY